MSEVNYKKLDWDDLVSRAKDGDKGAKSEISRRLMTMSECDLESYKDEPTLAALVKKEVNRRIERKRDADLIEKAKRGDESAFSMLFTLHDDRLVEILYDRTKQRQLAEDIAQETWRKAFTSLDNYVEEYKFTGWLHTIAGKLLIDFGRRQTTWGRTPETEAAKGGETQVVRIDDKAIDPQSLAEKQDEIDRCRRALGALNEVERKVLDLKLVEGLSFREIGDHLETSEYKATCRYHEAVDKLRSELDGDQGRSAG